MLGQVEGRHREQQADEEIVAPVAARKQRHAEAERDRDRKQHVDRRGGDGQRREQQHAARDPQPGQRHQRASRGRRPARPVAHCGEQEPGDDRQRVAEDHLVGMPHRAIEVRMREPACVLRGPERDRQGRERTGEQIERPKAQPPQRQAVGRRRVAGGRVQIEWRRHGRRVPVTGGPADPAAGGHCSARRRAGRCLRARRWSGSTDLPATPAQPAGAGLPRRAPHQPQPKGDWRLETRPSSVKNTDPLPVAG